LALCKRFSCAMLGAWMESQLGAGMSVPRTNEACSGAPPAASHLLDEPQSLMRSLPGVTMFVNESGDPLTTLPPRSAREQSSSRRQFSPSSGQLFRQGLLTVPHAAVGLCRKDVHVPRLMLSPDRNAKAATACVSRASSSVCGSLVSPSGTSTKAYLLSPGRSVVGSSPEQAPTRRALQQMLDAAAIECSVLDWSMPSSSSWVPSGNRWPQAAAVASPSPRPCRTQHETESISFEKERRGNEDASRMEAGPASTQPQQFFIGTPCADRCGSGDDIENRSPNPNRGALGSARPHSPVVMGDSTSLLYASPVVAGDGSLGRSLPKEYNGDVFHLSESECTSSAREPSPISSFIEGFREGCEQAAPMEAFRCALRAAGGLDSGLRQDLLSLVDHLDRPAYPEKQQERGAAGKAQPTGHVSMKKLPQGRMPSSSPPRITQPTQPAMRPSLPRSSSLRSGSPKSSLVGSSPCLSPPSTPKAAHARPGSPEGSPPRSAEQWGSTPSTLKRKWRSGARTKTSPPYVLCGVYDDVSMSSPTQSEVEAALDTMVTPPRAKTSLHEDLPLTSHVPGDSPPLWMGSSSSPADSISPLPVHLRRSACVPFSSPPEPCHLKLGDTVQLDDQASPMPGSARRCASGAAMTPLPAHLRRSACAPMSLESQACSKHMESSLVPRICADAGPAFDTTPLPLHQRSTSCPQSDMPGSGALSHFASELSPLPPSPPVRGVHVPLKASQGPSLVEAAAGRVTRRGSGALAAARDDFKVSVSACKRSQTFSDSVLSELSTLGASPLSARQR